MIAFKSFKRMFGDSRARVARLVLALIFTFLIPAAAPAAEPYSGWWLPINVASEYGQRQDFVFNVILGITAVLAGTVYLLMAYAMIFHRARPGRKALYTHSSRRTQIGILAFFTVFVLGGEILVLGQITGDMWDRVKAHIPAGAMEVEIMAEQFAWNVRYPGPDGRFGTSDIELMDEENVFGVSEDDENAADDIVSYELHLPVNTPVHLRLRSKDVLHSFFIPVLRIKQDVLPGQGMDVWVKGIQTGNFELVCAELCGLGHSTMKGGVTLESPEDFQGWLKEQSGNQ